MTQHRAPFLPRPERSSSPRGWLTCGPTMSASSGHSSRICSTLNDDRAVSSPRLSTGISPGAVDDPPDEGIDADSGKKVLNVLVATSRVEQHYPVGAPIEALHWATQSLYRSPSALGQHFRRMRARLGTPEATTAVAHKLARIIYHLITHRVAYDSSPPRSARTGAALNAGSEGRHTHSVMSLSRRPPDCCFSGAWLSELHSLGSLRPISDLLPSIQDSSTG